MFFQKKNNEASQQQALLEELEEKLNRSEEARIRLETRMAGLLEFIRIMAHNLRGPVGNLEQLTEIIPQLPPGEEQEEYLELMAPTIQAIQASLNDLGSIIDIQSKTKPVYDTCQMASLLEDVKKRLQQPLSARQAVIAASFEVPVLQYPKDYLENILFQLLHFALFNTKADVLPYLSVSTGKDGNQTYLQVGIKSPAFETEKGDLLFKYQKPSPSGPNGQENGLFIIKNQLETLGGRIIITNRPDLGAVFTAFL